MKEKHSNKPHERSVRVRGISVVLQKYSYTDTQCYRLQALPARDIERALDC